MHTINVTTVQEFMTSHMNEIMETMFSLQTSSKPGPMPPDGLERVIGSVGFAGESITGAVYLYLSNDFAIELAATMLGTNGAGVTEAEVNDVVGELTNMLAGGLKSWLCDSGSSCAVSTPGIIRGRSVAIELLPEVEQVFLGFSSASHRFSIEVHFKHN